MVIYLRRLLPNAFSGLANMHRIFAGAGKRPTLAPTALHPTGVYLASTSQCCWCALTAPLHPYLGGSAQLARPTIHRRYVSVALSSRSLALGVTQQVWSLGSPDFPRIAKQLATIAPTLSKPSVVEGAKNEAWEIGDRSHPLSWIPGHPG
jgi:hypothetical protein